MATNLQNLSEHNLKEIEAPESLNFGIVRAEWNDEITASLAKACEETLLSFGIQADNIFKVDVPGSFELPLGGQLLYEAEKPDAIICIGCLIQGETPHFDFISQAVATGIMQLNKKYQTPFIFSVLTTLTLEQALDRAGGKHGNKGTEAAISALKMIQLKRKVFKPF